MTIDLERDWFIKEPFLVPVGTVLAYTILTLGKEYLFVYTVLDEFMSNSTEDIRVKSCGGEIHNGCGSPAFYVNFDPASSISFTLPDTQVKTKTVLFKDQTTLDEIEFFPSTPTPEQFKAMQELAEVSKSLYEEPNFKQVDFSEELADLHFNQEKYFDGGFFGKVLGDDPDQKPNSQGGIKFDSKKARPTLLLKSMPDAVQEVIDVLELGARKYAPDNWKKVENARYEDAELRHKLARFSGEKYDPETNKYHLAHEICNLMFLLQKEMEGLD
jgi:Domain of unknown function (DUF5664)